MSVSNKYTVLKKYVMTALAYGMDKKQMILLLTANFNEEEAIAFVNTIMEELDNP